MTAISCSLAAGDLIVCTNAAAASGSLRMNGAEFRSIIAACNEILGGLDLSYRQATRFSADARSLATRRESIELSTWLLPLMEDAGLMAEERGLTLPTSLAHEIALAHNGSLTLEASELTTFALRLAFSVETS